MNSFSISLVDSYLYSYIMGSISETHHIQDMVDEGLSNST